MASASDVQKFAAASSVVGSLSSRSFRQEVENLIATEPTIEEIDDFLGKYDELMRQPVTLH